MSRDPPVWQLQGELTSVDDRLGGSFMVDVVQAAQEQEQPDGAR